jgi:hypothetical protein
MQVFKGLILSTVKAKIQYYDLLIYSYNAIVVVGYSVFPKIREVFLFSKRTRLALQLSIVGLDSCHNIT